jgi:hypothetical protein
LRKPQKLNGSGTITRLEEIPAVDVLKVDEKFREFTIVK